MTKQFYNLYDAASILGIGYSTLRLHIKERRIPTVIIGKRKFVTATTIEKLEQSAR